MPRPRQAQYIRARGPKKWQLRWELPPDPLTGKRSQRWETVVAATKTDAIVYWRKIQAEIDAGDVPGRLGARSTFGAVAVRWMEDVKRVDGTRPKTLENYRTCLDHRLIPAFGACRLDQLAPDVIQRKIREWAEAGLSPNTIRVHRFVLRAVCQQAVDWNLLATNPVVRTKGLKLTQRPAAWWTFGEARAFLTVADAHPYAIAFWLALFAGMREGEVLGLRWADVDTAHRLIRVRQQLICLRGVPPYLGPVKTNEGARDIPLDGRTWDRVLAHQQTPRQDSEGIDLDLVLPSRNGTPVNPSNLRRASNRLQVEAGVPRLTFHQLRHTQGSWADTVGMPPRMLSDRLGHSDPSFTQRVYVHHATEAQREWAERMAAAVWTGHR